MLYEMFSFGVYFLHKEAVIYGKRHFPAGHCGPCPGAEAL